MAITLWRRREPFGFLTNFEREIDRWFGEDWFGLNRHCESYFTRYNGQYLDTGR